MADEIAQLAGECAIIRQAVVLAAWVGPEGKALTRVGVLRKPAVPAACAAIGIRVPERFRSAADVPGLPGRGPPLLPSASWRSLTTVRSPVPNWAGGQEK